VRIRPVDSSGSLVVEALVGIALLGTIAASAQLVQVAAHDARARSLERMVATWEMRSELEQWGPVRGQGSEELTGDGSLHRSVAFGPVVIAVERTSTLVGDLWLSDECSEPVAEHTARAIRMSVQADREGGPAASMVSLRRIRGLGGTGVGEGQQGAAVLLIEILDSSQQPWADAWVTTASQGDDAGPSSLVDRTGSTGCVVHRQMPAGPQDVLVDLPEHLDRLHRPLEQARGVPLAPGAVTRLRIVSEPAATLAVRAVAEGGAVLPDLVEGGDLGWTVAADGVLPFAPLSSALRLHPGHHDVVVSVCARATSIGAWSSVVLEPATQVEHDVVLPSVTLPEIVVPSEGVRITAQRDTDCPGSAGVRPVLVWNIASGSPESDLHAPVIALPDGPWVVHIRTSGGTNLLGPLRIEVSHTDGGQ
jgi:hypothetical protein